MKVGRKRKTNKHLPPRVYINGGRYYYSVPPKLVNVYRKKWINLGDNLRDALINYAQIIEPNRSDSDIAAIWRDYEARVLPGNAEATQKDKRASWKRLEPVFGACEPDDIRPQDIAAYLDLSATVHANREIALLSHLFTKAIRWGRATVNPCRGVERNKERARTLIVTDEMLTDWIKAAPAMLAVYAELAYLTGLRKTDLIRLRWSDVSAEAVAFTARKTGKPAVITRTDELDAVIARCKALKNSGKVTRLTSHLIHGKGGRPYSISGFNTAWQRASTDFKGKRFAPNDLRAKHASDFEAQGGDATKNLQHSSRQVTARHYLREATVITPLRKKAK